jgi:hypothetical protein
MCKNTLGYASNQEVSKSMKAEEVPLPTEPLLKQNAILSGLSRSMIKEVIGTGRLIALETPQQIYEAGRPIREVYFPINAVLSVVTQMRDGGSIEVGTVGREAFPQFRCCSERRPQPTRVTVKFRATPS